MTYCTMHHAAQGENLIVNGQKTCWLQFGQKPVGRQQKDFADSITIFRKTNSKQIFIPDKN